MHSFVIKHAKKSFVTRTKLKKKDNLPTSQIKRNWKNNLRAILP